MWAKLSDGKEADWKKRRKKNISLKRLFEANTKLKNKKQWKSKDNKNMIYEVGKTMFTLKENQTEKVR